MKERKVVTQSGLHRIFRREADKGKKMLLRNLLVCGFNATHWPLWDLLKAAVGLAEEKTVSLLAPRKFASEVDEIWIGSWEEETGGAVAIPDAVFAEVPEPFAGWVASYETGAAFDAGSCDFTFLASPELVGQVNAIVLQALTYLGRPSCGRLGIVFPEPNALALGVAEELTKLGVPLDDGTGSWKPGVFERRTWPTWLSLQEEPSVERLLDWIRAAEAEGMGLGTSLVARELTRTVDEALGETLVDDLSFLAIHLAENELARGRAAEVAEFLRSRIQLPDEGTFAAFMEGTQQAVRQLGWDRHFALENVEAPAWLRDADWPLSRRTFLEWLRESTDSRERTRGAESNHFYGKVHLLIYAQMPGMTWTHLILTGLNEGRWPKLFESGAFGSRHELMELNRRAGSLNRRGVGQGGQGEGHTSVLPERAYCLLPRERQDLALRDLCTAVEGTSESVCFTAMTSEAGRTLLPSDFLAAAYQAKTGRMLDEVAFPALAKASADWLEAHRDILAPLVKRETAVEDISQTQIAFVARREALQGFGRYEFAYAQPPAEPLQLPCKTWETAWSDPASIWLERIVGVRPWPEGELAWARAMGTWVHRWLASALRESQGSGGIKNFLPLLRTAADREPMRLREQMYRAGGALYPWWNHVWNQARSVALGLGESLASHLPDRFILSEFPLPHRTRVALPGVYPEDFELRGQVDLLLVSPLAGNFDPADQDLTGCACWVIDFKTGAAKTLTTSRMEKGQGLQTMLYALAVKSMGAMSTGVSLHILDTTLKQQVQVEQIESNVSLFASLDRMHRTGVFGMKPPPDSDYGFSPVYPLATRPISASTLEAKWALVHGASSLWEGA